MLTETIVVAGMSGYLGTYIARHLHRRGHEVVGLDRSHKVDVRDYIALKRFFKTHRPTALVDCIDYGSVSECEKHPIEAEETIVRGASLLASICQYNGIYPIYFSTSYVYDGKKPMRQESEGPTPINKYGELKLMAEHRQNKDALVLRTSGIYGYLAKSEDNWDMAAVSQWKRGGMFKGFTNRWTTPTYIGDLATAVDYGLKHRLSGLYHAAGPERVSRHQFFEKLSTKFSGKTLYALCDDELRPTDASLCSDKLRDATGIEFSSVDDGVKRADYSPLERRWVSR